MPANNYRLIKAAKRTIRAELTLIVVIILVASWSVYALYKLVISVDTDSNLLVSNQSSATTQDNNKQNSSRQLTKLTSYDNAHYGDYPSDATVSSEKVEPTITMSPPDQIAAKLTMYKNQIMQELFARQQQLRNNRNDLNVRRDSSPLMDKFTNEAGDLRGEVSLHASSAGADYQSSPSSLYDTSRKNFYTKHSGDNDNGFHWLMKKQRPAQLSNWPRKDLPPAITSDFLTPKTSVESSDETLTNDELHNDEQEVSTPQPVEVVTQLSGPDFGESTTIEPMGAQSDVPDSERQTDNSESSGSLELVSTSTIEPEEAGASSDDSNDQSEQDSRQDKIDDDAMRRVKNTVHSIDEEVDRMMQPSSGTVSQSHDPPVDYEQTTVQFDDNPVTPVSDNSFSSLHKHRPAVFTKSESEFDRSKVIIPKQMNKQNDLQVDNNRLIHSKEQRFASDKLSSSSMQNLLRNKYRPSEILKQPRRTTNSHGPVLRPDSYVTSLAHRLKRSIAAEIKSRFRRDATSSSSSEVTATDKKMRELLEHKRLLDMLRRERNKSTNLNAASTVTPSDHKAADTGYTVEEGLLLYPEGGYNPHHTHGSGATSKKKFSKKKSNKKMMIGMKKGGEKSKKHKHDLKKFHKEKHFKGAKKGKKMKKGKGGKGGKKGKKFYKDKGFKKKGFKDIYVKSEFGQKKSYFDEFRDKDFKKKWKNFDEKYKHESMKKWQAKDVKGAKKLKDHGEKYKKFKKGKWKKKYLADKQSELSKKKKKSDQFR